MTRILTNRQTMPNSSSMMRKRGAPGAGPGGQQQQSLSNTGDSVSTTENRDATILYNGGPGSSAVTSTSSSSNVGSLNVISSPPSVSSNSSNPTSSAEHDDDDNMKSSRSTASSAADIFCGKRRNMSPLDLLISILSNDRTRFIILVCIGTCVVLLFGVILMDDHSSAFHPRKRKRNQQFSQDKHRQRFEVRETRSHAGSSRASIVGGATLSTLGMKRTTKDTKQQPSLKESVADPVQSLLTKDAGQQPAVSVTTAMAALDAYEKDCSSIQFTSPATRKGSWTTKPIWMPSYPTSMEDRVVKSLITSLTGNPAGAKSYYASRKGLRKCKGDTETVVCTLIHPMIMMDPTPAHAKYTSSFSPAVIYALRNPATAIPAHINSKEIQYHHHPSGEQISEATWKAHRDGENDKFLVTLQEWSRQLRTWRNMTLNTSDSSPYYRVEMYIAYERFMDYRTGPELVLQLTTLLQSQGFDIPVASQLIPASLSGTKNGDKTPLVANQTAVDVNLAATCLWYQSIGKTKLRQHAKYQFEYSSYRPSYLVNQQQLMIKELSDLKNELGSATERARGDAALKQILEEYLENVQHNLAIDK
jgi:hypothetical protein